MLMSQPRTAAMRPLLAVFAAAVLATTATPPAQAQSEPALESVTQRFSYAVGLQLGQRLSSQGLQDVDSAAIAAAIEDVLNRREPRLSIADMQEAATAYQAMLNERLAEQAAANSKAENEFLAANKTRDGIVELPSGVQYRIIEEGEGAQPAKDAEVTVHYRGRLIDGTEFDSSYQRGEPTNLKLDQVIEGWQEVLPQMKEGAKWEIFVPSALAYGDRGAGTAIGPNQTLVFEIELMKAAAETTAQ